MSWACLEITALWERWAWAPPALTLGTGSHCLYISFHLSLPSLMVPRSALFAICSLFKQVALGRGAVYSLFAKIMSFSMSKGTQQGRTLSSAVALLSVDTGRLQMEDVCKASLAQPPLAGCHRGEKNHADVWKLACKRTSFSGTFPAPLPELKKPGLVR